MILVTCMYVCMYMVSTFSRVWINGVRLPILRSWSAEQGKLIFLCPRSSLRIWFRERRSAVPSRVSPLTLHAQAASGAYSRNSSRFPRRRPHVYRQPPSGQVHRVTQLRTDGLHCRKSAGTEPAMLKVVPVTGAAFSAVTMDHFFMHLSFP